MNSVLKSIVIAFGSIVLVCGGLIGGTTYVGNQMARQRAANAEATRVARTENLACAPENERANVIFFTGYASDIFDSVPNDYLVLVYRGREEVGRGTTSTGKQTFVEREGEVLDDGYFEVRVDNDVRIAPCDIEDTAYRFQQINRQFANNILLGELSTLDINAPNAINVPSKNFAYTIWILQSPIPPDITDNSTELIGDEIRIVADGGEFDVDLSYIEAEIMLSDEFEYTTVANSARNTNYENCNNTQAIERELTQSRSFAQSYSFDIGVGGDVAALLQVAAPSVPNILDSILSAEFSRSDSDSETDDIVIPINVPPGEHIRYEFYFREVWQPGTITLTNTETGATQTVEFSTKLGLEAVVSTESISCD